MRYPAWGIARRYLFSRKSTRVVNLISMITALAMAVGTAALIIVMTVFNGFEGLIKSLYKVFYTDLVVLPAEGKFIVPSESVEDIVRKTPGLLAYSAVLEENILAEYSGRQYIATLKGVDDRYPEVVHELDSFMLEGRRDTRFGDIPMAVAGAGVAYSLGISLSMPNAYIRLYMPKSDKTALGDVANAFRQDGILLGGIFAVQQDFDSRYILTPLSFARQLMDANEKISAWEIRLKDPSKADAAGEALQKALGLEYVVKTRFEQNETLYKVMRTEKWAVFTILSFIILIAAFNIIGSLSMLVIEKRSDIATLRALGADKSMIRRIFLLEGMLMSLLGAFTGLAVGGIICYIQQEVGVVPMPGTTFLIQYYPVKLLWTDFLLVGTVTVGISALMAWLPAHRAVQNLEQAVPGRI